jgi:hypothetical protein
MKKQILYRVLVMFLFFAVVILGFKVSNQQNKLTSNESERAEIEVLLNGSNAAFGYSCGVLSAQRAEQLMGNGSNLNRKFGQGPADTVQDMKNKQENIFWSDSCRYEDPANSGKYIEMYVATFQTDKAAVKAFPDFFRVVNDVKEIPDQDFGQQLFYDGGVYYLLKDNKVIQTAASNGLPQELESFSRKVFESIVLSL